MRTKAATSQDQTPVLTPRSPWRVKSCKPLQNYRLHVRFMDGIEGYVDMSRRLLSNDSGVFSHLKDEQVFSQVYVKYGVVTWPGDIDIAPDTIYDIIKEHGEWIAE